MSAYDDYWFFDYYSYEYSPLTWSSLLDSLPKNTKNSLPCYDNGKLTEKAFEENSFSIIYGGSDDWTEIDAYPKHILARYYNRCCLKCKELCSFKEMLEFLAELTGKKIMYNEERFAFVKVRKCKKITTSMLCTYYLSLSICPKCLPLKREFIWNTDYHCTTIWSFSRQSSFKDYVKIPPLILWMSRYTKSIWKYLPFEIIQTISQFVLFSHSKKFIQICK